MATTTKDALREAFDSVQCDCSIRERDSGHKVDCWYPALEAAIVVLLQANRRQRREHVALRDIYRDLAGIQTELGFLFSRVTDLKEAGCASPADVERVGLMINQVEGRLAVLDALVQP